VVLQPLVSPMSLARVRRKLVAKKKEVVCYLHLVRARDIGDKSGSFPHQPLDVFADCTAAALFSVGSICKFLVHRWVDLPVWRR